MLGTLDIEEAAKKAAGNWKRFDSFVWFRDRELEDADQWSVIYTHNRDSGLLDQSNSHVISQSMESFTEGDEPDVVFESHSHFAVGHVDGFSVRVFNATGNITAAFRAYHELAERLDDYPILDEADYSNREFEATLDNIKDAAWRVVKRSLSSWPDSSGGRADFPAARSKTKTTRAVIRLSKHFGQHSRPWASRSRKNESHKRN